MNSDNKNLIVKIGIFIALYFLFLYPVLVKMGLIKGKGDRLAAGEAADPQSPFSPNLWRSYFYQANTPANGRKPLTEQIAARLQISADRVNNAFGYIYDDEALFFKALAECKTRAEVSLMAFYLQQRHTESLLSLMQFGKGNLPENGLSSKEMEQAINYVKKLNEA